MPTPEGSDTNADSTRNRGSFRAQMSQAANTSREKRDKASNEDPASVNNQLFLRNFCYCILLFTTTTIIIIVYIG